MEEKYLRITEFAGIAKTNRKTLQYYDELGLFCPALVGENGYRYYSLAQLDRLALICVLRDMGMPLREIKSYIQCGSEETLNGLLETQLERVDQMVEQLRHRKILLTEMMEENRIFQSLCGKGYQLIDWPCQWAVKLMNKAHEGPVTVNYLTDGLRVGLCVQEQESFFYQRRENGDICIPAGTYLCLCDLVEQAPQERSPKQAAQLREYATGEGLHLDNRCFVEYNDLLFPQRDGKQFLMRMLRIPII